MEELKLTGNHLKGSRPVLSFSTNFEESAHWKLVKEMLTQVYIFFVCFVILVSISVVKLGCSSGTSFNH